MTTAGHFEPSSAPDKDASNGASTGPIAVVGAGRLGSALVRALSGAGLAVSGPHGRGYTGAGASVVVLCVPDAAITAAAGFVLDGPLVAHCSGATSLAAIAPHRGFSLHPVMTVTHDTGPAAFQGVGAAVAATDAAALAVARGMAASIGLRTFEVAEKDRIAYHAATAMASNFLVTLEEAAARLVRSARVDPQVLLPLARAALENWGRMGAAALTGPIARGDHAVVAAHHAAVSERAAELLPLFDALAASTAALAARAASTADLAAGATSTTDLARTGHTLSSTRDLT